MIVGVFPVAVLPSGPGLSLTEAGAGRPPVVIEQRFHKRPSWSLGDVPIIGLDTCVLVSPTVSE